MRTPPINDNHRVYELHTPEKQSFWKQWICKLLGVKSEEAIAWKIEQDMIMMKAMKYLDPKSQSDLRTKGLEKIVAKRTDNGVALTLEFKKYCFHLQFERDSEKISRPIINTFSITEKLELRASL